MLSAVMGSFRMRLPVAEKTAFATAGAIGGNPGSPTPPGGSVLMFQSLAFHPFSRWESHESYFVLPPHLRYLSFHLT